ncbi:cytochrome c-type biogenesis protein [Caulobacter sp. S45]|jgi:cytochrome c-type biogenesis protein CcmH|uniref:cytochrome c-type biogenesis protein n=1 Tax=Caulobacter sp. S45 TaxID=1641861 RepID=UPI00131D19C7|nr:cytochrome c-type biogenesis protein [Caulobacter sp. S45]
MRRRALLVALAAALCLGAAAGDPAEVLHNSAQEARARTLFRQVRCLVCQNESIDDSEADLAEDLRRIVRQQILAGRSDVEIKAFLTQRYGEFVLMRPAFSPANAALWLSPFVVVGLGGLVVLSRRRRLKDSQGEPSLTPEEEERLHALYASPISEAMVPPQVGPTNDLPV